MKLKSYILVGYIISTLLTIIVVFWAVQKMLIEKSEIYFLLGMTIVASLVGAGISLFLLSPVFTSLGKLKEHAKRVADKDFPSNLEVQGPVEFQQLGQAFNEMSHDLQATFDSLEESEREKGWQEDYVDDTNTLNVHIHALRQELAKHASAETPTIKTVWGLGYKIEKARGS